MIQAQDPRAAWLPPLAAGFLGLSPGNRQHQACSVPEDKHVGPFPFETLLLNKNSSRKSEVSQTQVLFGSPLGHGFHP